MSRRDRDATLPSGEPHERTFELEVEVEGSDLAPSSLPAVHIDSEPPASSTNLPTERPREVPGTSPTALPPAFSHPLSDQEDSDQRRSLTIARKQMLRDRRRLLAQGHLPVIIEYDRPRSRADCRNGKRPCLYVACRYHLYLDVNPATGSIKINFPDKEVHELEETCALDVAERGGVTLEEVGSIMNLTRERIRQVEASGLDKLRESGRDLDAFLDG